MTTDPSRRATALVVGSGVSSQVGAAVAAGAFSAIGPAGVVAVRQLVAAVVLLPVARPPLRRMTWAQWWPTLLLAAVYGTMNLSLYTAIDRLGLGLSVTLEFLGPLSVALVGARTRAHAATAVAAAVGVYVLVLPGPSSDLVGVAVGLLAGACWAAYILLNRLLGQRMTGLHAPAVASTVAAMAYLPVLLLAAQDGRLTWQALALASTAGVLSTLVPFTIDLVALRHLTASVFGVLMSLQPVWAALAGLVILRESLAGHEVVGIVAIALANATAQRLGRRGGPAGHDAAHTAANLAVDPAGDPVTVPSIEAAADPAGGPIAVAGTTGAGVVRTG